MLYCAVLVSTVQQSESTIHISPLFWISFPFRSPQTIKWNSPGQNIGVGNLFLFQGIFPTQGSNPGLLHCRQFLYHLSHQGSPLSVYKIMLILGDDQGPIQTGTDSTHVGGGLGRIRTMESPGKDQGLASSEGELFHLGAHENSHSILPMERGPVSSLEMSTLQSWLFWMSSSIP